MVFDNIGIKHVFLCINICWAARGMLKCEPERRVFQPLPSIRKACLIVIIALGNVLTRNNVEIVSKSSFSIVCTMAPRRFENAAFRAYTNVSITSQNNACYSARFMWWRQILWRPRNLTRKVSYPFINSTWIALLIHGFCSVNTWLLKAYDTVFYAIIAVAHRVSTKLARSTRF